MSQLTAVRLHWQRGEDTPADVEYLLRILALGYALDAWKTGGAPAKDGT